MTHTETLAIAPAPARAHRGMTVFPLLALDPVELPYRLLSGAIADGLVEIRELDEQGSVPELLAVNRGDVEVLVLDGEQLIGAKQNRMASRTLLLPAESKTKIPVSCIEQGRWRTRSATFRTSRQHSPTRTRKSVRELEAKLTKEKRTAGAEQLGAAQGAVWSDVAEYSQALRASSPTAALDEVHESATLRVEGLVGAFPAEKGQVGLLAFHGTTPLGLDVIGGQALYARLHERLLRGYALDVLAVGSRLDSKAADEGLALRFLDRIQRAERTQASTVGSGTYVILSETVVGAELIDGDRLAHRSAFTEDRKC